ncbi:hypothetical protein VNO78_20936 [Psophocarpus tetragonolobus]|uniref:Uncharacterized protein n=1 Tax=Psophocarpus tetragonolobus TaxID=3891 RepID=A0AAN9XHP2_PSOTE
MFFSLATLYSLFCVSMKSVSNYVLFFPLKQRSPLGDIVDSCMLSHLATCLTVRKLDYDKEFFSFFARRHASLSDL